MLTLGTQLPRCEEAQATGRGHIYVFQLTALLRFQSIANINYQTCEAALH